VEIEDGAVSAVSVRGRRQKAREGKSGEGPVVPRRERTLEDEEAQESHALGSV
jgi:hypothetical protein